MSVCIESENSCYLILFICGKFLFWRQNWEPSLHLQHFALITILQRFLAWSSAWCFAFYHPYFSEVFLQLLMFKTYLCIYLLEHQKCRVCVCEKEREGERERPLVCCLLFYSPNDFNAQDWASPNLEWSLEITIGLLCWVYWPTSLAIN